MWFMHKDFLKLVLWDHEEEVTIQEKGDKMKGKQVIWDLIFKMNSYLISLKFSLGLGVEEEMQSCLKFF